MKSLLFTAILSLRKRSEQLLIKFAILLQVRLTHAQTFFRGVDFRSLYQGLLIFHAPCTKKILGTRLACVLSPEAEDFLHSPDNFCTLLVVTIPILLKFSIKTMNYIQRVNHRQFYCFCFYI